MEQPWPLSGLAGWCRRGFRAPCRDDRFFPAEFMRRMVRRLAITPDAMDGSHCPAQPPQGAGRLRLGRPSGPVQLHPLVVPQDSQTKQEPAGRMRTPQVEQ